METFACLIRNIILVNVTIYSVFYSHPLLTYCFSFYRSWCQSLACLLWESNPNPFVWEAMTISTRPHSAWSYSFYVDAKDVVTVHCNCYGSLLLLLCSILDLNVELCIRLLPSLFGEDDSLIYEPTGEVWTILYVWSYWIRITSCVVLYWLGLSSDVIYAPCPIRLLHISLFYWPVSTCLQWQIE